LPPSDPTGDWVVLSPRDEEVLYRFHADTRNDAERIKWSWCNANGVTDPDIYRLAHRAAEYEAPSRSNDIEEVPLDIEIAPPRSSSGNFTGYWKITDSNGRELHRFNGVGNAQADANRIAREWMQQHAPMQTFYVYPVMA
jgi:bacterioferritin-associated ferredoxin